MTERLVLEFLSTLGGRLANMLFIRMFMRGPRLPCTQVLGTAVHSWPERRLL